MYTTGAARDGVEFAFAQICRILALRADFGAGADWFIVVHGVLPRDRSDRSTSNH